MRSRYSWHSKFLVLLGVIWVAALASMILIPGRARKGELFGHPIALWILVLLLVITGSDLLIARKFWIEKYANAFETWGVRFDTRLLVGMVIFSGLMAMMAGIALGVKLFIFAFSS